MARKERMRYWKISAEDTDTFDYDESKLLNWEIKCIREPEVENHFIGVFMYRNGTAYDYESVKGICYFHNNIDREELPEITKFLQSKFEGKEMIKGDRVFLKDSKEIFTSKEIGKLAKELEIKFNAKATISLEFEDISSDELKAAGMPDSKLLPIPK
ncbi:MAG: hypothetical protein NLN56_01540 [Nitrosopumilus sp.]|jgi:hypothetical protein|nr:hypothetical protein [Nitrosopumilus sp.]